jgi:SAM-dependent methyltransferase
MVALADDYSCAEIERSCPLCDGNEHRPRSDLSSPPWRIAECARCAFVYLANPVDYSDLVEDHAWEKSRQRESARRREDRPLLDRSSKGTRWRLRLAGNTNARVLAKVFSGGRVLDVGCGGGRALPEPLVPFGVEISRDLATRADHVMLRRGGYCVHAPALEGIKTFDAGFFQGVLLRSFLEHETNPLPLLHDVHRVLAPDGVAYVRVPNFASFNRRVMGRKWCGFRYPDHVNYFTPRSLVRMAAEAGFAMDVQNAIRLPFDDNIKALLRKRGGREGAGWARPG